jgi:hypothetical protein
VNEVDFLDTTYLPPMYRPLKMVIVKELSGFLCVTRVLLSPFLLPAAASILKPLTPRLHPSRPKHFVDVALDDPIAS